MSRLKAKNTMKLSDLFRLLLFAIVFGILLAVLLFVIVLSTKIHYRTYITCPVFIEQGFLEEVISGYKVKFRLKPEDIAFICERQNATINRVYVN